MLNSRHHFVDLEVGVDSELLIFQIFINSLNHQIHFNGRNQLGSIRRIERTVWVLANHIIVKADVIQNDIREKQKIISLFVFLDVIVQLAVMRFLSVNHSFSTNYSFLSYKSHGMQQLIKFWIRQIDRLRANKTRINIQEIFD